MLVGALAVQAQERFSPFVGSQPDTIERMIRLSGLKAGEVALDLGSGDGRIIVAAAMTEPRMRGWGVDIDAALVARANAFAREEGVDDRVRFLHGDVFDADVGRADVIFMWLFPELQRLLAASKAYLQSNQAEVIRATATKTLDTLKSPVSPRR